MELVCSIKPNYLEAILEGKKTIEVRRRVPKHLGPGDVLYVHASGEDAALVQVRIVVDCVECVDPWDLWEVHRRELCIEADDYLRYACASADNVWAIKIRKASRLPGDHMPITRLGLEKAPQWFAYVRQEEVRHGVL